MKKNTYNIVVYITQRHKDNIFSRNYVIIT